MLGVKIIYIYESYVELLRTFRVIIIKQLFCIFEQLRAEVVL